MTKMNCGTLVRRSILALFDIVIIVASYMIAILFVGNMGNMFSIEMRNNCIIAVITYMLMFMLGKVYKNITKYTGSSEYINFVGLSITSFFIILAEKYIVSIKLLGIKENLLASCFIAGLMICSRVIYRFLIIWYEGRKKPTTSREKILVIGAGNTGLQVIRDLLPRLDKRYKVVGIIDDSPAKFHSVVKGVSIIGGRNKIIDTCKNNGVDTILFTISSISTEEKREILNICNKTKAKVKLIPNMKELISSDKPLNINLFKDLQIEDLLGREPIKLENEEIGDYINGKVVVVTGAGGSIGSELCRQVASFGAKQLLMIDIYENTLYETELEIRKKFPSLDLTAIVASVRDKKRIEEIFDKYSPEIVFHAAAHKHVPLMETSPIEAIKNNVFGTLNVAQVADKFDVDKFVLVSTDKAVNPTSIMGATKRICEMIIQMQNVKSKTNFVAVRFGNVLGSHGSVIPIFKKQIEQGGPVTVTHKNITRFFMTIPEAVGLILQATVFAEGGEIFVLDMGEPVKIYDLAEKMIRLSGFEPNVDIPIEITGLRPGEKLYEELLVSEEGLARTVHKKIMVTKIMEFNEKDVTDALDTLHGILDEKVPVSKETIIKAIKEIVPTFIDKSKVEEDCK